MPNPCSFFQYIYIDIYRYTDIFIYIDIYRYIEINIDIYIYKYILQKRTLTSLLTLKKNVAFFYKERNRTQRTPRSFIKNVKECSVLFIKNAK